MEKVYYSIREAQQLTGLPASTLRFWETMFPQLDPHIPTDNRRRYYTPKDIELIKQIKYLRDDRHLSVPAIQKELQANSQTVNAQQKVVEQLRELQQMLIEIRQHL